MGKDMDKIDTPTFIESIRKSFAVGVAFLMVSVGTTFSYLVLILMSDDTHINYYGVAILFFILAIMMLFGFYKLMLVDHFLRKEQEFQCYKRSLQEEKTLQYGPSYTQRPRQGK